MRSKREIRALIWDRLQQAGVARPPLPPHGRIPNFQGAERAAERLAATPEWRRARVVKINPDSPQRPVRYRALSEGKTVVMPTPRLRSGFLLLDHHRIPPGRLREASTIRGAFKYATPLPRVEDLARIGRIDLIVEGSVAVNRWGERLGKGEGYAELEYAILLELGLIEREVPIATTVHDLQVLEERLPQDPYDVPVDYIYTPTRSIKTTDRPPRPPGILWSLLSREKLEEIPLLAELKNLKHGKQE